MQKIEEEAENVPDTSRYFLYCDPSHLPCIPFLLKVNPPPFALALVNKTPAKVK